MTTTITKAAVKQDMQRVARSAGSKNMTRSLYRAKGKFSSWTAEERFGTWNKALRAAGVNN